MFNSYTITVGTVIRPDSGSFGSGRISGNMPDTAGLEPVNRYSFKPKLTNSLKNGKEL